MKPERYEHLTLNGAPLSDAEREGGWHYCADWDFLLIHKSWDEFECCTCDLSKIPKQTKALNIQDLDDVLRKADPEGHDEGMREAREWAKGADITQFIARFDTDTEAQELLAEGGRRVKEWRDTLPGITPIDKAKLRAKELISWALRNRGRF